MVSIDSKIQWSAFSWVQWCDQQPLMNAMSNLLAPFHLKELFDCAGHEKRKIFVETLHLLLTLSHDTELLAAATYSLLAVSVPHNVLKLENVAVRKIVQEYIHLQDIAFRAQNSVAFYKESIKKMLLATVDDPRLVVVMLAQVLSLLRQSVDYPPEYSSDLARLTLDIFAPIAHRLGIGQLKWEMEDLSFQLLYPEEYQRLRSDLAQTKASREHYIKNLLEIVHDFLAKESISASVSGRSKHFYSIWKKMRSKNKTLSEVYDLSAIRILVDNIQDCYRVLGMIHTQWKYLPQEFNDYIANPKVNGYQSLHTAVFGLNNQIVEVQIRTQHMNNHAEMGIAAHWMYKEHHKDQERSHQRKLQTLRHLLEQHECLGHDVFESMKEEIFEDRIYVFTPKGDLYDLPQGSTPLDFAYHIHTELGHHCCGARSDARMLSLSEPLMNGMIVEILTAQRIHPSRDWLNPHYGYLNTSRARQKVSHWFRSLDKDRHIQEGKVLFEKLLKKSGYLTHHPIPWDKILDSHYCKTRDDFYHCYSLGEIKSTRILDLIVDPLKKQETPVSTKEHQDLTRHAHVIFSELGSHVQYGLASCCAPSYGDPIVGLINRGRAMTVHKMECATLRSIPHWDLRLIMAQWSENEPFYHRVAHVMSDSAIESEFLQKIIDCFLQRHVFCYLASEAAEKIWLTQMDLFSPLNLENGAIENLIQEVWLKNGRNIQDYQLTLLEL